MNLDVVLAILTGVLAICAFSIHILSSPGSKNWMTLPRHIRWGLGVTGTLMMIRSVNFLNLAGSDIAQAGHANLEALAVTLAMVYTVVSFTIYAASERLPSHAWDRVRFVLRSMRRNSSAVPVMMTSCEVTRAHRASGQPTVSGGGRPEEVVGEAARAQRMAGRTVS